MGVFSKGNKKFECNVDPETKETVCESFRELSDGSRVPLASLRMQVDGMCNPVATNMQEHEDGALEELEKKVQGRLVAKCQKNMRGANKPSDY